MSDLPDQCKTASAYICSFFQHTYVIIVHISGEADRFYTTEITSQFKEAFPVLYAEYDEQETAKKKKKLKKKKPGLCLVSKICIVDFVFYVIVVTWA